MATLAPNACAIRTLSELSWAYLAQMAANEPTKAAQVLPILAQVYRDKRDLIAPTFGEAASLLPAPSAVDADRGAWGASTRTVVLVLLYLVFRNATILSEADRAAASSAMENLPTAASALGAYVRTNLTRYVRPGWELAEYDLFLADVAPADAGPALREFVSRDLTSNCFVEDVHSDGSTTTTPPVWQTWLTTGRTRFWSPRITFPPTDQGSSRTPMDSTGSSQNQNQGSSRTPMDSTGSSQASAPLAPEPASGSGAVFFAAAGVAALGWIVYRSRTQRATI